MAESSSTSATASRRRPSKPSTDQGRRAVAACGYCKGRKTKCMGFPYPCAACIKTGRECIYPSIEKRVPVPESILRDLMSRAGVTSWQQEVLKSDKEELSTTAQDCEQSSVEKEEEEEDYLLSERFNNLLVSDSGERHYVGTSSSTWMARQLPGASQDLSFELILHYNESSLARRYPLTPPMPLPPYDYVENVLYPAQREYIGTIFSFVQPPHFRARLQRIYTQGPDPLSQHSCLEYCQILLVCAFGRLYSINQYGDEDGPPGFEFFKQALDYLPDIHERGSVLFIEVLSMLSYFMQVLNRRDAAFHLIGLALRMAISLGLHQEVTDINIGVVEQEHRRRVWWSVFSMDRIISVKSGMPMSVHDADINVGPPEYLADLDEGNPSPPRVLKHYTELSKILGTIGEFYRQQHKSGEALSKSVQSIMVDLSKWVTALPTELRIDFKTIDLNLSREAVSTYLHYYQCGNMTVRPLLFYVTQKRLEAVASGTASADWKDGLSPMIVSVIDRAIAEARATTVVTSAAADHNRLATFGFMDGEHVFSSALVLVMINIAFPQTQRDESAMRKAMAVLQGMASRGNNYARARYTFLEDLLTQFGIMLSPPDFSGAPRMSTTQNMFDQLQDLDVEGLQPYADNEGDGSRFSHNGAIDPQFQEQYLQFDVINDETMWQEMPRFVNHDMEHWAQSVRRKDTPDVLPAGTGTGG